MIRRDYILRMIEEFIQALARIKSLKQQQLWNEAACTLDEQFHKLIGASPEASIQFSETELMARLIQGEPTQAVREKTFLFTALLKEAGDLAVTQNQAEDGARYYLKGLHLLLDIMGRGETFEFPEFVPRIEIFVAALQGKPLPLETHARLMQHYERSGEFAKAEDALFEMVELEPENPAIIDFGVSFYRRLQGQPEAILVAGNLPRSELENGIAELQARRGMK